MKVYHDSEDCNASAIRNAREARRSVLANGDLSAAGRKKALADWTQRVARGDLARATYHAWAIRSRVKGIETAIGKLVEQRRTARSPQRIAEAHHVQRLLLELGERERDSALVTILQSGDVEMIEAVTSYPAALDRVPALRLSSTVNIANREAFESKLREIVSPELTADLEDARMLARGAATMTTFSAWEVQRATEVDIDWNAPDLAQWRDLRAVLQQEKLDTLDHKALRAAEIAAQKEQADAAEYLERRAAEFQATSVGPTTSAEVGEAQRLAGEFQQRIGDLANGTATVGS